MNNTCPKCGEKLGVFYLKPNCPKCGVNIMYYKLDERLREDAKNAQQEVVDVWKFIRKLDKASVIEKYCKKKNKPFPWDE